MLKLTIPAKEYYDELKEEFISTEEVHLELEHSLVSLSKWESKYERPFLSSTDRSDEETYDYIYMMISSPEVAPDIVDLLTQSNLEAINDHINSKMTATWFAEIPGEKKPNREEVITAELIYYWMIALNIPFECQHWHLERLLTLVRVCNQKNAPEKKMSKSELIARNRELNVKRRAEMNTTG